LITITLAGNVNITGDADIDGGLNVDGPITGFETLEGLNCATDRLAKFDGDNWVCVKLTVQNDSIITVDSAVNVGQYTSIVIGSDNLPVISYYDVVSTRLKVAHCGNAMCSSGNTITTVAPTATGEYSSIAIGADNLPVISYRSGTGDLKVLRCINLLCNTSYNVSLVDSIDNVGAYTSIAIGTDNNPVISYYDETNGSLKVAHCGNATCSSGNILNIADNTADVVGKYTSIAIGSDDMPVISYYDETNGNLKLLHCGTTACNGLNTITTLQSAGDIGTYSSIAIGSDGNPVISYIHDGSLRIIHCGNQLCDSGNSVIFGDTVIFGDSILYTSIATGSNNNPMISYFANNAADLKVLRCGNVTCSSGNIITTVDFQGVVGQHSSIVIGSDGNPVISYYHFNRGDLKVAVEGSILIFE